jgi:hypothetical protein
MINADSNAFGTAEYIELVGTLSEIAVNGLEVKFRDGLVLVYGCWDIEFGSPFLNFCIC